MDFCDQLQLRCHFFCYKVQGGFLLSWYGRIFVHLVTIVKIYYFNRSLPTFPFKSVWLQSKLLRKIKQWIVYLCFHLSQEYIKKKGW